MKHGCECVCVYRSRVKQVWGAQAGSQGGRGIPGCRARSVSHCLCSLSGHPHSSLLPHSPCHHEHHNLYQVELQDSLCGWGEGEKERDFKNFNTITRAVQLLDDLSTLALSWTGIGYMRNSFLNGERDKTAHSPSLSSICSTHTHISHPLT